ncbi:MULTISPECIES: SAM-dependent methyltransferase [unclassified Pseudofrankia]|uniref:SAM-dependent methyltransferase n=1 Tax=unclassified Pseudofrankia TaxID=2994372 RepID=UPI0009F4B6C5|nr:MULTISPECIES: SAM-dependent methyltransferase [unclassified Pseudofrankia]MDT3440404.1 SAM-dependent methyltransferase [Pseudofrankia sp. BMG5.37]
MADSGITGNTAWNAEPTGGEHVDLRIDIPHGARVHDYLLGGKDHYLADRTAGEAILASAPWLTENVRAGRNFLGRAVHLLAAERGVRQYLDIGTGLPTANNTHAVAQRAAPDARVVYVDRDPIALAHGRALLTSTPEGTTDYLLGDVREPADILARAADILDFTQPVALVLVGIMHYLHHADGPWAAVRTLSDALPADSYLVLTHLGIAEEISSLDGAVTTLDTSDYSRPLTSMVEHFYPRSLDEIKRFFYGWELLDPGVTLAPHWRAEDPELAGVWAAVARKPA